ncbi:MAG: 3'-5' exonuclease, partial [Bacteroidales bacterium]|nr:3'-5' exonuclease [Bacteroidales bacterium]
MNLNLKKPLAFFDLETTGLNVAHDCIIEICVLKINPDQTEETFVSRIKPMLNNQLVPISKEASEITGIKDEDLKGCPTFKEIAPKLIQFFENCDLGGFNSNKFDI